MDAIYLDANASTPLDPQVADAMLPYMREHFGNATSGHARGRLLAAAMESARAEVAALLDCEPDEIVFTSGGSESNNLAVKGAAHAYRSRRGAHLVQSAVEHPSVANAMHALDRAGWTVTTVGVDRFGRVSPHGLRQALTEQTALVSIILAQNETGTIQPIADLAAIAREAGVPVFHTDAAQAVGKIPVRVRDLGVDLLTLAAHKFCGPWGIGAMYLRRGCQLEPLIHGSDHEHGLRAGTPNISAMVGLGAAASLARRRVSADQERLRALRDRLWERLRAEPGVALHGHPDEGLPNTLNVGFEGVFGADVLAGAPQVHASTGSACHSGSQELSGVLAAMGVPAATGLGAVRLSLCRTTTESDVDAAASFLLEAVRSLRSEAATSALA